MNWDMVGAVGEIVGAGAVVLTLWYLARQVQETAKQDQRRQSAALQQHFADLLNLMVTDDRLPLVFMAGIRDYWALDEEQKVRFGAWMLNVLRAQEQVFHFEQEGGIHVYQEGSLKRTLREVMATPGAQAYWESRREWFSPAFQEEVDRWASHRGLDLLSRYEDRDATSGTAQRQQPDVRTGSV